MKLDEIEKLCEEATRGRWEASDLHVKAIDIDNGYIVASTLYSDFDNEASRSNVKFIAASRTLMPLLLEIAKAAKEFFDETNKPGSSKNSIPIIERLMNAVDALEKA